MTQTELLTRLRVLLCDEQKVGYPDDSELIGYLDRAVVYYSEQMIAVKSPDMLKRMAVVGCCDLPEDFVSLAGQWPVEVRGRHMDYYGDSPMNVMYFASLPLVSGKPSGDVDITCVALPVVLDLARMFALNRNEYDLSQDLKLVEFWQNAAKGAR